MRGRQRQWFLVVCVWLGLLTLFTANGHPFRERDTEMGINDDPAEAQPLSLSENDNEGDITSLSNAAIISPNASPKPTNTWTGAGLKNTSMAPKVLNNSASSNNFSQVRGQSINKTLTGAASTTATRNVAIIATTTPRAGSSFSLASIRNSSVNTVLNSSQTMEIIPKSSNGLNLSTSTSSIKPSVTFIPPTVNHLSQHASNNIHVSSVGSAIIPTLALHASVLPTSLSAKSSVGLNLNVSSSTTTVKPTIGVASTSRTAANVIPTSSVSLQNAAVSKMALALSSAPVKKIVSAAPTTQNLPSSSAVPSTQSLSGAPSTKNPSGAPSTTGKTEVLSVSTGATSTGATKVPSTHTTPEVSTIGSTKPSTQTSTKLPSTTKVSKGPLTTGPASSLSPTTEVKAPPSTSKAPRTKKPSTEISIAEKTTKPSTQGSKKPSTKSSSTAPVTKGVPSTVPKKPTTNTKPQTKKITTKVEAMTRKTTAEESKTGNQNNDEGKMPPPDKGREAVLWDFIVPVAIGTGVALVIAFGVILVRTCRRRRLIKVRFGGKPSNPRLLNNDLINLLAESDDEEE